MKTAHNVLFRIARGRACAEGQVLSEHGQQCQALGSPYPLEALYCMQRSALDEAGI